MASATLTAAVMLAFAPVASPAVAVQGGQVDSGGLYANVGRLEVQVEPGVWGGFCSGTLIAVDIVLTAAHCAATLAEGITSPTDIRVNFDPLAIGRTSDVAPMAYLTAGAAIPDTFGEPAPSSGIQALAVPWDDIGLVFLATSVSGIDPAPYAGPGYLDTIDAGATFTVVGYGLTGFVTGSAVSPAGSAQALGRTFVQDVKILGAGPFPDRYVLISAANCFGDSGGPLLHGETVVGVTVWTNSWRCEGSGFDYRVDSPVAQELIGDHL
jgi:hypothetical protein